MDAIEQLAARQLVIDSAEIEAELRARSGPIVSIWRELRKTAADSLREIVLLNVYDPQDRIAIITHQNKVKRYAEFALAMKKIFDEGKEIGKQLNAEEWRDIVELIKGMPEAEQPRIEMGVSDDDVDPPPD